MNTSENNRRKNKIKLNLILKIDDSIIVFLCAYNNTLYVYFLRFKFCIIL